MNLNKVSGYGRNNDRANISQTKYTICGGTNHSAEKCFKTIRKYKGKARAAGDSDIQQAERTPRKYFKCGSVDHIIAKYPKPPKDNEKQ